MNDEFSPLNWQCPGPESPDDTVQLGHGSGGELTQDLIDRVFRPCFAASGINSSEDAATLPLGGEQLVMTTDSFVVQPRVFPGGDIGKLAVCGTVNDLAMAGARPLYLSCAFILEEGMSMRELTGIAASMQREAAALGVQLSTADTKVVERGKGDGIYINTTGIGMLVGQGGIGPAGIRDGDCVILSGDLGRHGMAVMASREGLQFDPPLESDCAALWPMVGALLDAGIPLHCLRDLTRGGLATALVELAETSNQHIVLEEAAIVVSDAVRGACELLGLDPLYVANEGRFVAFVPEDAVQDTLAILEGWPEGRDSRLVGRVSGAGAGVVCRSPLGSERLLRRLPGEQLPRIC